MTGASGCGKTSLLNLVAGLRLAQSGEVTVLGQNLNTLSPRQRDATRGRRVGRIFQELNLLEPFTALENILIGLRFAGLASEPDAAERAHRLIKEAGLDHRTHVKVSMLSAGERQRVAVVRALAPRPDILLADEPTGSLDPVRADLLCRLIQQMCREQNTALVLVTHDHLLANLFERRFDAEGLIRETVTA